MEKKKQEILYTGTNMMNVTIMHGKHLVIRKIRKKKKIDSHHFLLEKKPFSISVQVI